MSGCTTSAAAESEPWPEADDPMQGCEAQTFPFACATKAGASPLVDMDYYSDDYPDTPVDEFLAVYEKLTKFAQREIRDLAQSLAATTCGTEGDG